MTIHYQGHGVTLHHGDCLDVLRALPDASVDSVVTDPPYGLEFMGKEWDSFKATGSSSLMHSPKDEGREFTNASGHMWDNTKALPRFAAGAPFQRWCELWAAECLRVLKPGGHLLAFGGTRTWHRLACAVEDAGFEVRDSIAWMYGSGFPKSLDVSKAIDKAAGAEREVVGPNLTRHGGGLGVLHGGGIGAEVGDVTAPATPDAQRWQGWGTALKPSHEPVCVARKPLRDSDILDTIGSHLDALEAQWQAPEADPTTPTGAAGGSPDRTDMSPSGSTALTSSSTVSSWRACWVELCELTSTSTTETTSSTTTALKTLSSSLSSLTHESTHPSATSPHGSTSLASAVDNLFASVVCGLRATLALSATEPATGRTPRSPLAAVEGSPAFEPVVVARKPLSGTVAATVLEHGTGALNIDGCRIGDGDDRTSGGPTGARAGEGYGGGWSDANAGRARPSGGRWPANVVLDESQAEALDEQSGETSYNPPGKFGTQKVDSRAQGSTNIGPRGEGDEIFGYGDRGGASRFFFVAKAPKRERPSYAKEGAGEGRVIEGASGKVRECRQCGNRTIRSGETQPACGHNDFAFVPTAQREERVSHPTVKPLALMRWLVRLVTPPGGTVLEPFAGSGTTVEACIVEGFDCIAIEKGDEYLPLIMQRIHRRRDPVAAIRQTGDELGLFELDGEGA